ncbi:MAG: CHASE3 domain-containing protein, partial [Verrucomicrobia bacterium]|nr:CHASE3 domain-containing protein [Verrucomicrobiota bacterium]
MKILRSTTARPNIAKLGIAVLVLMVMVGFSYREWQRYSRANADAARTREILDSVGGLLSNLIDAETGQRGFLLTGEDRYLQPYNQAVQTVPNELARLTSLLAARRDEPGNVARLNNLTNQKLGELRQTIDLRRMQGSTPALALVLSDQGKRVMDEFRGICADIQRRENSAQGQASSEGEAAAQIALLVTVAGSLLLVFFFVVGLEPFLSGESGMRERTWLARYGGAVLATGAATVLRMGLTPLVGESHSPVPFITFFPAVLVASWYGGFRAGALCILLSALAADYFFLGPERSFWKLNPGDLISLLIFIVVGFGIAFVSHSQRRAVARADRAENAERLQRRRFEMTVASIGDAVIATDADGRITFTNKVAQSLMRAAEADLAGQHLDDVFRIVNAFTRAKVESPAAKVLREGAIVGLANHTILIARDGTEIPIDDSGAPIRDRDGKLTGVVLVFRDITERQRAEQERLESLSKDRALASEKALRQAETELALVNRALVLGESAASIAHEVNQPLAAVVTNAEAGLRWLGGETPDIREARESLALIVRDGNRASEVIRHIR